MGGGGVTTKRSHSPQASKHNGEAAAASSGRERTAGRGQRGARTVQQRVAAGASRAKLAVPPKGSQQAEQAAGAPGSRQRQRQQRQQPGRRVGPRFLGERLGDPAAASGHTSTSSSRMSTSSSTSSSAAAAASLRTEASGAGVAGRAIEISQPRSPKPWRSWRGMACFNHGLARIQSPHAYSSEPPSLKDVDVVHSPCLWAPGDLDCACSLLHLTYT